MSVKTYSVGVETINDENPTATEIKFNNEIIWKREVNPPLRGSLNLFDEQTLPPSDTEIKNDTINSDEVQYEDIIENDKTDFTGSSPLLGRRPDVPRDEINGRNPLFEKKKPVISMEKRNDPLYQGSTASSRGKDVRSKTIGGSKRRRVGTRKNKKKTKTMRRNRRNL